MKLKFGDVLEFHRDPKERRLVVMVIGPDPLGPIGRFRCQCFIDSFDFKFDRTAMDKIGSYDLLTRYGDVKPEWFLHTWERPTNG